MTSMACSAGPLNPPQQACCRAIFEADQVVTFSKQQVLAPALLFPDQSVLLDLAIKVESSGAHTRKEEESDTHNSGSLKSEVRYGVIGTGMMGLEHIYNLKAVEGARIVAVADVWAPSREAAMEAVGSKDLKVFSTHSDLLDSKSCDAVIVATPNMTHCDVLLDILRHPHPPHVLIEKPLCTNIRDCKKVLDAARKQTKAMVQVGLEYRYIPAIACLIREVQQGYVGRVHMVAIREHRFPFLVKVQNWNRFNRNTGGTLVEKCCHFFNLMTLIIGAKPTRVIASGSQALNHLDEEYDGQVPDILDNAYVIVEYEGGARGLLDLCMFAEGSRNEQEISVVGSQGKIDAYIPESVIRLGTRSGGRDSVTTVEVHDERVKYEGLHHGSSYLEHLEFLKAVRSHGRVAPSVSLEEGLLAVAIGVAAHRSIDVGLPVLLADVLEDAQSVVHQCADQICDVCLTCHSS